MPLALVALAFIGASVFIAWEDYDSANEEATVSREILDHTGRLLRSMLDARTAERGFLLTGRTDYLAPFSAGARLASGEITALEQLLGSRPELGDELTVLAPAIRNALSEMERAIHAREAGGAQAALHLVRTDSAKLAMDQVRQSCARITEAETARWRAEAGRRHHKGQSMLAVASTGGAGLFILLAVALGLIQRSANQRERLIADLYERSELLRTTLAGVGDAVLATDARGVITFLNGVAGELTGWPPAQAIGQPVASVCHAIQEATRQPVECPVEKVLRDRKATGPASPAILLRRDGSEVPIASAGSPILGRDGSLLGVVLVFRDVSEERRAAGERRRMDERFQQSAKLESLGVLAGGIAHDFNNLLVGIIGNASLALEHVPPESELRTPLDQVIASGDRAAALIRQMLAYAGKGRFFVQPVLLPDLIRETLPLIQSSIPRTVQLRLELGAVPPVEADASQLQQVVMNLLINAGEACGPCPAVVGVSVAERRIEPAEIPSLHAATDIAPGRYVCLEVRDTGQGMDEATLARIFDPFYTTKFTGRGLGLAAVLGIVRGHKGALQVASVPGEGTVFRVFLPPAALEASPPGATVLLVEGEEHVRRMASAALERCGFVVSAAADSTAALAAVNRSAGGIRAVVLDIGDPAGEPTQLLEELRRMRSDLPLVVTSGLDEADARFRLEGLPVAAIVPKPYTADALCRAVRAAAGPLTAASH